MFVFVEAAFDDVATLVVLDVVAHGTATLRAAADAVPLLVGRLGDDGDDAAAAEVPADRARRVRLVATDPVWAGAGPARPASGDSEMVHQNREHRCVAGLTGPDEHDQRQSVAVDEVVDLRAQTTT